MKAFCILALSIFGIFPSVIQAKIENLRFYGLWLGIWDAKIFRFDSTLIVPPSPPGSDAGNGFPAVWPGVQGIGLLQNVVHIVKIGQWWQQPYYCCNPPQNLANKTRVYPGDHVTNTFSYDAGTMIWHDSFVVMPAASHSKAVGKIKTEGFDFDQPAHVSDNSTINDHFNWTFMTIELQGNTTWNFGPVEWRDILVRANTSDTEWCTKGPILNGGATFNYTFSKPKATSSHGTSSCYIAEMIFHSP